MNKEKIVNLLSMAQRAGKVASGSFAVEKALAKGGAAKLILIATDASEETRRELLESARLRDIPAFSVLTKEETGRFTGKGQRAAAAVLDEGFAKALEERIRGAERI